MIDEKKFRPSEFEQLALGLEVDEEEIEGEVSISAVERDLRSETARKALEGSLRGASPLTQTPPLTPTPPLAPPQNKNNFGEGENNLTPAPTPPPAPPQNKSNFGEGISKMEWAEEYFLLRQARWPWRVAAYIAWASSPKIGRWPKSQDELARVVLGLTSDRVIATWRKKNAAIDDVIALMQAKPLLDHRRDVFKALSESAADPSFHGSQDRKTFLSMTGDYVPHQKIELEREKVDPVEMTEAELAIAEKLRKA